MSWCGAAFTTSARCSATRQSALRPRLPPADPRPLRGGRTFVGDEDDLAHFSGWFIQQHRLHDGRTIIDCYVAARPDLPEAEREFLLGWRDVREGVFEVTGRAGAVLHTMNLVDDLPYRIRTNSDEAILDHMPSRDVHRQPHRARKRWLAAQRHHSSLPRPRPGVQRAQHAAFAAHFGSDELVLSVDHFDVAIRGFWDACSGKPDTAPPTDLDWIDNATESIGVIYDQQTGLGMYADYHLARQAFADPDLMRRRLHKEIVKAYLNDESVDPVPPTTPRRTAP